ncbi:MAG: MFS transporter [Chloroflexi bacterium]|nr:MAG: MFS transporter [Chloroflexota bacterium]
MNPNLAVLGLSLFLWGIGEGMFWFFQPLYLEELGADPIAIGTILGGLAVAMTVAHIPAGYLADRFGRRPIIWAAWRVGLVSAWVMALSQTLPIFITGLIAYGLTAFVMAPMNSYATAARGKLSTARVITLTSTAFNLGAIIGPITGGVIAERAGIRTIYFVAASLFVVSNIAVLFLRKQPVETRLHEDENKRFRFQWRYLGFMGIVFLTIFSTYLPQPLSSNFLQNERNLDYGDIGQLGSISSMGVVFFNLILGHLDARIGFLLGQIAVAGFAFLLWRGNGLIWFQIGYFLMGGFRTTRSLAMAQVRDLIPPSVMGLAYGMTETVSALATIVAPVVAGYLYTAEPVNIYIGGFFCILISLIVSVGYLRRTDERRLRSEPSNQKSEVRGQ